MLQYSTQNSTSEYVGYKAATPLPDRRPPSEYTSSINPCVINEDLISTSPRSVWLCTKMAANGLISVQIEILH